MAVSPQNFISPTIVDYNRKYFQQKTKNCMLGIKHHPKIRIPAILLTRAVCFIDWRNPSMTIQMSNRRGPRNSPSRSWGQGGVQSYSSLQFLTCHEREMNQEWGQDAEWVYYATGGHKHPAWPLNQRAGCCMRTPSLPAPLLIQPTHYSLNTHHNSSHGSIHQQLKHNITLSVFNLVKRKDKSKC